MARTFDGAQDNLHCSIGGNNITGAFTCVAIIRRNSNTAFHNLVTVHSSGGTATYGIEIEDNTGGNNLQIQVNAEFLYSAFSVTTAQGWQLVAAGKQAGVTDAQMHQYIYGTDTWTHQNAAGNFSGNPNSTSGGSVRFGEWEAVDDYNGDLAIAAIFNRNLTNAEVEELAYSLQAWYALSPTGLWIFDQSATTQTVIDSTGNGANQTSIAGTTIATTSLPVFSYGFPVPTLYSITTITTRSFDGVDDVIVLDEGTLDTVLGGAFTVGVLFRRFGDTNDGTQFLTVFDGGVNTDQRGSVSISPSNAIQLTVGGITRTFGLTISNNVWYLLVVKKGTGTATPRANLYNYETAAWVGWADGNDTLDTDGTTLVEVRLGNGPGNFPLNGSIAGAVVYTTALSDVNAETLETGAQEWDDLNPTALWLLNQSSTGTSVTDETGNGANQTAITGTAIFDTSTLPFDFVITGGGGATATPATVTGTTSIPTPGIVSNATVTPALVAGTATINTPTITSNVTIAPATVAGSATINTPTIIASSIVSAVTVTGTTTIPTPTVSAGGATAAPATVVGTTSIPTPSIVSRVAITAAVVTGTTSIPTPTINASSIISAITVLGTTTIPTPGVVAGGNVNILATTVVGTTTIPTPTIVSHAIAAPATVVGVATIFSPSIRLSVAIQPPVVSGVASIPTPQVVAGSRIAAVTVLGTTTIPTPTVVTITAAQPATVLGIATIPTPVVITGSFVTPVTVFGVTTIPFPTIVAIIPEPLPSDYDIDLTPVSIPIASGGITVSSDATVST